MPPDGKDWDLDRGRARCSWLLFSTKEDSQEEEFDCRSSIRVNDSWVISAVVADSSFVITKGMEVSGEEPISKDGCSLERERE
jgi:hypothetical protein